MQQVLLSSFWRHWGHYFSSLFRPGLVDIFRAKQTSSNPSSACREAEGTPQCFLLFHTLVKLFPLSLICSMGNIMGSRGDVAGDAFTPLKPVAPASSSVHCSYLPLSWTPRESLWLRPREPVARGAVGVRMPPRRNLAWEFLSMVELRRNWLAEAKEKAEWLVEADSATWPRLARVTRKGTSPAPWLS